MSQIETWVRHVSRVEQNRYLMRRTQDLAQVLCLDRLRDPVQHDHRTLGGKSPGDAQADAAGGSGHDGNAAIQRSRTRHAGQARRSHDIIHNSDPFGVAPTGVVTAKPACAVDRKPMPGGNEADALLL
jgi:hypothetical protein